APRETRGASSADQRLGRYAAVVDAGPAHELALDDRGLTRGIPRAHGERRARLSRSDDDRLELLRHAGSLRGCRFDLPCLAGKAVDAARELVARRGGGFMDDDAFHGVDRPAPGRERQHAVRFSMSGLPARADAAWRKVDVLELVLAVDARCDQPCAVHGRAAPPRREFPDLGGAARFFRHVLRELTDDVAKVMDLLLACDMALGAARELDVLLPAHHL